MKTPSALWRLRLFLALAAFIPLPGFGAPGPSITQQPQSRTVLAGTNVIFKVTANGLDPLTYQWWWKGVGYLNWYQVLDGESFSGSQTAQLTLGSASNAWEGSFLVVVTDRHGTSTTSAAATLVVDYAATISLQPSSVSTMIGSNVTLQCHVFAEPPAAIRWYRDGAPLSDGGRFSGSVTGFLSISNTQPSDAGGYHCVATNIYGSVTSQVAQVSFFYPPTILSHPQPQTVIAGRIAGFSATASGTQPLRFQLRRNGADVFGMNGTGGTNWSFIFSETHPSQEGSYSIVVSNDYGFAISSNALLTVLVPPAISQQPQSQSKTPGSLVTLSATATGTAPLSYQWLRNGEPLTNSARISGTTSATLSVSGALTNDNGSYQVQVTNMAGMVTSTAATLTILEQVSIVQQPQPLSVIVGSNAVFQVTAAGDQPIGYSWRVNGSVLQNNSMFSGVNTPTLTISGVTIFQAATYTVLVTNPASSVLSTGVVLTVLTPPHFTLHPVSGNLPVGTNLLLTGSATGTQPITYRWLLNGTPLSDDLRLSGSGSSTLAITNLTTGDSGSYSLVASNNAMSVTSSVAVVTIGYPPTITGQPTPAQTVAVSNTVHMNVEATGTEPLTYQWRQNSTPLTDNGHFFGTTTSSLTVSNAQTSDSQQFSVVISNPFGTTTSSNAALTVLAPPTITIQPKGRSVPRGLPTIFSAAVAGGSPLGCQWLLNGTNLPNATALSYTNPAVSADNLGTYELVVTNAVGSVTSSVAMLTFGPVAAWGTSPNASPQLLPPPELSNVAALAAGSTFSLALKHDGTVVAWGSSPATNVPPNLTNAVAIGAGSSQALAVRANGTVVAWGSGTETNVPATVSNIVSVTGNVRHSLALRREGIPVEWATTSFHTPPTKLTSIADGNLFSIAGRSDGRVVQWGSNLAGAPGKGSSEPIFVPGISNAVSVAAGYWTGFALKSDGRVVAWGSSQVQTNVPASLTNVAAIAASGVYQESFLGRCLALRSNGLVVAWGDSSYGHTNIPSGLSNVVAIAMGGGHNLALVSDGSPVVTRPPVGGTAFTGTSFALDALVSGKMPITCFWSHNGTNIPGATTASLVLSNVQLSDAGVYRLTASNALGSVKSVAVPVAVMNGAPSFLSIPTNRTVFYGSPLLIETVVAGSQPIQFQWRLNGVNLSGATNSDLLLPPVNVASGNYALFASNAFGSALSTNVVVKVIGPVIAWGMNENGLTNVPSSTSNAIAIATGHTYYTALKSDGTVTTWGLNAPVPPSGLSNVVEISGWTPGSLALKSDGTVEGWGSGINSSSVSTLSDIVSVEQDGGGSTFLRTDGTLLRLVGTTFTEPAGASNIVSLTQFGNSYIGLRSDGTLHLGGGGILPPSNTTNVMAVAASAVQGIYLRRNGSIAAWGNTNVPPSGPNVAGVAIHTSPNIGAKAAIRSDGSLALWSNTSGDARTNAPVGVSSYSIVEGGNYGFMAMLSTQILRLPPIYLSDALDTPALVVSSKGSSQWFGQTNITHDGSHAAQSGFVGNGTASSMRLWVQGPITASFWWKVSSEANHDTLRFRVGSSNAVSISGEVDWEQHAVSVPPGNHLLQWIYTKDNNGISSGKDAAWVDQIQLIPQAPAFVIEPASTNVIGGANITLTASATGTPPLTYRWRKNGNFLSGATGSSLFLPNVTRSNSGAYSIIVTNAGGNITSTNAILTVRVPQLLAGPTLLPDGTLTLLSSDLDGGTVSASDLADFEAQAGTNLFDWETLPNALSITNGMLQLHDSEQGKFPTRFYRIIEH